MEPGLLPTKGRAECHVYGGAYKQEEGGEKLRHAVTAGLLSTLQLQAWYLQGWVVTVLVRLTMVHG